MITVKDLSMRYGSVVALRNATFAVQRGEVVGLLGPNGAGKSTTMKILTTYLYPTSGSAVVGEKDVLTSPWKFGNSLVTSPKPCRFTPIPTCTPICNSWARRAACRARCCASARSGWCSAAAWRPCTAS